MRAIFIVVALCSVASAEVAPVKAPPADTTHEMLEVIARATTAERTGNLSGAIAIVQRAVDRSPRRDPHPPYLTYNLARLFLRAGNVGKARAAFADYLAVAPDAPDAAQITKLVADLAAAKRPLVLGGGIPFAAVEGTASIFVDGEPVGPSPAAISFDGKEHRATRIGQGSFAIELIRANTDEAYIPMRPRQNVKGNVLIDLGTRSLRFTLSDQTTVTTSTLTDLPVGRFSSKLGYLCEPLEFEVKSKMTTYVYVDETFHRDEKCAKVTKKRVHYVPAEAIK